eukprot:COSAG02_NODE_577_length_20095_cov_6.816413_5_plen_114_part_00
MCPSRLRRSTQVATESTARYFLTPKLLGRRPSDFGQVLTLAWRTSISLADCLANGHLAGPLPGKRPSRVAAVAERMTRNSYIFDNGGGLGGRARVGRVIVGVGIINDEFTAVW